MPRARAQNAISHARKQCATNRLQVSAHRLGPTTGDRLRAEAETISRPATNCLAPKVRKIESEFARSVFSAGHIRDALTRAMRRVIHCKPFSVP
jgi:hypothetical protein